jgi:hypothetical protein
MPLVFFLIVFFWIKGWSNYKILTIDIVIVKKRSRKARLCCHCASTSSLIWLFRIYIILHYVCDRYKYHLFKNNFILKSHTVVYNYITYNMLCHPSHSLINNNYVLFRKISFYWNTKPNGIDFRFYRSNKRFIN